MPLPAATRDLLGTLTSPHDGQLVKQGTFLGYVLAISVLLTIVDPALVLSPEYLAGTGVILVLTLIAALAHRHDPRIVWLLVPIADILATSALRDVFRIEAATVTLLAFVPALWAARSWGYRGALAATTAVTLAFALPTLARAFPTIDAGVIVRALIIFLAVLQMTLLVAMATTRGLHEQGRTEEALRQKTDLLRITSERQNLLKNVIDSLSVGVVIIDRDGHDVLMNLTQRELHAAALPEGEPDPPEDHLLVRYPDSPMQVPAHLRPVRRAAAQESFTNYVVAIGPLDGPNRTMSTSARQIVDTEGQRDGAVIVFSDVTEFVRIARRQRRTTASVSHEMRTPLTSIMGYVDLALESPDLGAEVRRHLDVVERNAEQLLHYVEDLLSGLAESSTETPLELTPTRLDVLAREACDTLRPRAVEGGVELRLVTETEASIPLDPSRMTQVLINLISNGIKYTPRGGRVEVLVREGSGDLEARISDTGIRMTPDEQAGLFMEYYRSTTARDAQVPGYGLGLAITQRLVRAHGGQISVRSAQGKGSAFTVSLPRATVFAPRS